MKKPVILCIDDESVVLTSLKEQIKKHISGYDIEAADNGREAMDIIEELMTNKVDVAMVICDYIMPGMRGDEVLIKIHTLLPNTITILLTGQATMEGVTNSLNYANLYRYIGKPWEESDLILTITEGVKSFNKDIILKAQNKKLEAYNHELMVFTEAMVETLVTAVDARDKTTAGHSKRLAEYAVKLANEINSITEGRYADFKFTQQQLKELYYSALLHDVGKIGVKEVVLQKEFRLSKEKQNEIKYRFGYYRKLLEMKKSCGDMTDEEADIFSRLDSDEEFIRLIAQRDYTTEEDRKRIRYIAEIRYTDLDGTSKNLLNDSEVENLVIANGNLTEDEREMINSHVRYTNTILAKIPWTKGLEKVPEIAASHHERLDGSGFYLGITGDSLSVQTRILSIVDVYEALTAKDRPYRSPIASEKALAILEEEAEQGKFDTEILRIFKRLLLSGTVMKIS